MVTDKLKTNSSTADRRRPVLVTRLQTNQGELVRIRMELFQLMFRALSSERSGYHAGAAVLVDTWSAWCLVSKEDEIRGKERVCLISPLFLKKFP